MAQWHLDELQESLGQRGWRVTAKQPGDDYSISSTWVIRRNSQAAPLLLDFEGLDDMKTLPVEQSHGYHIRGHSAIGLYFGKKGHKSSSRRAKWHDELSQFVIRLDELQSV